ncbi:MAG: hypothetical protein ABFD92_02395 [Planctomycetaceae bacterium]|nr:soluble NSF attachment family protein [Planctomycetaceae bacterium]
MTLHLVHAGDAVRGTCAYFLPGGDAQRWLDTIASWGMAMKDLRLYVLANSVSDRTPIGALAAGPGIPPDMDSPAAVAYGCVGGKLYVPVDAVIHPQVSDVEIVSLLPGHLYVLHPSAPLAGFQSDDAVAAHQLVAPPCVDSRPWDRAVPGLAAPRLRSVTGPQLDELGDIIEAGREDISSDSPGQIAQLPDDPARGILGRAAARAASAGLGAIAAGLAALRRGARASGGQAAAAGAGGRPGGDGPGWLDKMAQWAAQKASTASQRLMAARFKELARLMRLMESDPDAGLRYALPLAGSTAHRGVARPGSRLGPRSTDFNLSRLGGGEAADFWDMPYEYQAQLMRQYRQAADREIALGRFRRAAYIYAVLLGDHHSAANVLKQGRHFREAAAVFRDHLKNPLEAARCLESGGLLLEAIAIFQEHKHFEKVGDLYTLLDRPEDAGEAFRKAVNQLLHEGNSLAAAALLETKLKAPQEALDILAQAWPATKQAGACLQERVSLLGRLGRHGDAQSLVRTLQSQTLPRHAVTLVESLAAAAQGYPDHPTRRVIGDAVRVVAGMTLDGASPSAAVAIGRTLVRLCPHDRLLSRDVDRYCGAKSKLHSAQAAPVRPSVSAGKAALVRTLQLPVEEAKAIEWSVFAAANGFLYAAGYDSQHLPCILAHDWQAGHNILRLRQVCASHEPLLLAVDPNSPSHVVVASPGGRRLHERQAVLPSGRRFLGGYPAWAPENVVAIAYDNVGLRVLCRVNEQLQLDSYCRDGRLQHSHFVGLAAGMAAAVPMFVPCSNGVWFAIGNQLYWDSQKFRRQGDQLETLEFETPIVSMAAAAPYSPVRIVVTLEEGARVIFTDADWPQQVKFGEGMLDPLAIFTSSGMVVVASRGQGGIYDIRKSGLKYIGGFDVPDERPLAVLNTGNAGEFAVVTESFKVRIFQLP